MTNGPSRDAVLSWLEGRIGRRLAPAEQADILGAAKADGDDAFELIDAFAAEFAVEMTGYQPLAHHHDEGALLRPGWPLHARPAFGVILPISVSLLHASALAGHWVERLPDLRPARNLAWANLPLLLIGLPLLTALIIALLF